MSNHLTYRLDAGHFGIRLSVLATIFMTGILSLFVLLPLVFRITDITNPSIRCILLIIAALAALGVSKLVENLLIRIWPSGRTLEIDEKKIMLVDNTNHLAEISWENRINITTWRIRNQKAQPWAPKGWYCMTCRLLQDDKLITVYTFMKPSKVKTLSQLSAFHILDFPDNKTNNSSQTLPSNAEQRLLLAERERWTDGFEMQDDDFIALLDTIERKIPDWPAKFATANHI